MAPVNFQKDAHQGINSLQVAEDGDRAMIPTSISARVKGSRIATQNYQAEISPRAPRNITPKSSTSQKSATFGTKAKNSSVATSSSQRVQQHRRHHSDRCILPRPAPKRAHRRFVSTPTLPPSGPVGTEGSVTANSSDIQEMYQELEQLQTFTEGADERTTRSNKYHGKVAHLCNSIGNHHFKCGQFDQALASYREALNGLVHSVGENHRSVSSTLTSMGTVGWKLGQYDYAVNCMNRSAEILHRIVGENHPETARALHNLGQAYCVRGDFDCAMEVAETALRIRREKLGKCDVEVARTISLLGTVSMHRGELKKAAVRHREALNLKRSLLGSQHPSVVVSLMDLGNVYHKRGNHEEALRSYKEALFLQRATMTPDPFSSGSSQNRRTDGKNTQHMADVGLTHHIIGNIYKDMGELGKCMDAYRKAGIMYRSANLADDHRCVSNLECSIQTVKQTN